MLDPSSQTFATPFHHDPHQDGVVFTVKSAPLFPTLSDPNPLSIPSATFADLRSSSCSSHNSLFRHNSNVFERVNDTSLMLFNIPNIRNNAGHLILPTHYCSRLQDKAIVILNVHLNLCVISSSMALL